MGFLTVWGGEAQDRCRSRDRLIHGQRLFHTMSGIAIEAQKHHASEVTAAAVMKSIWRGVALRRLTDHRVVTNRISFRTHGAHRNIHMGIRCTSASSARRPAVSSVPCHETSAQQQFDGIAFHLHQISRRSAQAPRRPRRHRTAPLKEHRQARSARSPTNTTAANVCLRVRTHTDPASSYSSMTLMAESRRRPVTGASPAGVVFTSGALKGPATRALID